MLHLIIFHILSIDPHEKQIPAFIAIRQARKEGMHVILTTIISKLITFLL